MSSVQPPLTADPKSPAATYGVDSYVLDEGSILHRQGQPGMFLLNALATYIYGTAICSHNDEAVLRTAVEELGQDDQTFREKVTELLAEWRQARLLPYADPASSAEPASVPVLPLLCEPELLPPTLGEGHISDYRILNWLVRINCPPPALREQIETALGHLRNLPSDREPKHGFSLSVQRESSECRIAGHGQSWWRGLEIEAVPALKAIAFKLAIDATPHLASVHAAALALNRECFLLVGPAGAGKSMLTLSLLKQGYDYLSDDCVILDDAYQARGVPFRPTVKRDGIELATSWFPRLREMPALRRPDGHLVCYLPVEGQTEFRALPVRAVFFTRFGHDLGNAVTPLSRFSGAVRLADFLQARQPFMGAEVCAFVAWIRTLKFVELTYSSDILAVEMVRSALAQETEGLRESNHSRDGMQPASISLGRMVGRL